MENEMRQRSEENICNKSVRSLLEWSFLVPVYQRGYRWTKFNVSQLLDDILENINKDYNLQALVLCEKGNDKIIIDGQQRITTLFLINSCIENILLEKKYKNFKIGYRSGEESKNFKIKYESREASKEFLSFFSELQDHNNLKWENVWEKFEAEYKEKHNETVRENIDFRYMCEAYEVIYEKLKDGNDIEKVRKHILDHCKFMIRNDEVNAKGGESQIIFNKLNMGKIYLRNSELIKSEYMNPKYYDENFDKMLLVSKTWNDIEKALRNPDFWAFIPHENQYGKREYQERNIFLPRIDEIFQLYLVHYYSDDGKIKKYEDKFIEHGRSKYFIYEQIKEKIEKEQVDIEQQWGEIERLFSNIRELYENDGRESKYISLLEKEHKHKNRTNIYNLIAYLIYMYADVQKKSVLEVDEFIIDLLKRSRKEREKFLKDKIREGFFEVYEISQEQVEDKETIKKEKIIEALNKIQYIEDNNENNEKIQNIFMLFNIILLQKNPAISNRYDFLKYRHWTIEHIFSQNEKKLVFKKKKELERIIKVLIEKNKQLENIKKNLECINSNHKENLSEKEKLEEGKEKLEEGKEKLEEGKEKLEEGKEKLEKEKEIIWIMRKEIVKSMVEYYEEEEKEEEKEEKNRMYLLGELFDVLNEEKEGSKKSLTEDFLDEHINKVCKNFIDELKNNYYFPEEYIRDKAEVHLKLGQDVNLDKLMGLYKELEQVKISDVPVDNNRNNEIYTQMQKEIADLYKKNYLNKFENRKLIYKEEIEEYFENNHNKYLNSNNICNLALLKRTENKGFGNEYLGKKEKMSKFISKGTAIPYSTLLVFTDRYLDVRKINNGERWQWLLGSRKKYFNDIVNTLFEFFKI